MHTAGQDGQNVKSVVAADVLLFACRATVQHELVALDQSFDPHTVGRLAALRVDGTALVIDDC